MRMCLWIKVLPSRRWMCSLFLSNLLQVRKGKCGRRTFQRALIRLLLMSFCALPCLTGSSSAYVLFCFFPPTGSPFEICRSCPEQNDMIRCGFTKEVGQECEKDPRGFISDLVALPLSLPLSWGGENKSLGETC